MNERRKSRARRRHTDSSDDDDDPQYDTFVDENGATRSKPLPTSEFPAYRNGLPSINRPEPLPDIRPDKFRQAQKEMLQMLSGLFAWDLFLNGKKQAKCDFEPAFMEAAKVRKQESSWKQSVTRRAALSIGEAVVNKDLDLTYSNLMKRQGLMDSERQKAHLMRLYPTAHEMCPTAAVPRMYQKQHARHGAAAGGAARSQTSMGTTPLPGRTSLPPPRAATSMLAAAPPATCTRATSPEEEHLLLLNDDMLLQEANHLMVSATRGSVPQSHLLAAHATLRHRSLTPLKDALHSVV